jgi:hypothetical protein
VRPPGAPDVDNPVVGMPGALCVAVAVLVTVVAVYTARRQAQPDDIAGLAPAMLILADLLDR